MATDVFISYSRQNLDFAEKLFDNLQHRDITSWVDWQNIPRSAGWWDEIKRGIDAASIFVFLLSNTSLASPICTLEIAHAIERGKRLIPVVIEQPDFDTPVPVHPEDNLFQKILADRDLFAITRDVRTILRERNWVFFNANAAGQPIPFDESVNDLMRTIKLDLPHARRHALLLVRINEWLAGNQADDLLLIGTEVDSAEAWLQAAEKENKEPRPTKDHREFITRSRQVEQRRRNILRRFQLGSLVFSVAAFVGIIVAILTGNEARNATLRANSEQTNIAVAGITLTPIPATLTSAADEVIHQQTIANDIATESAIRIANVQAEEELTNAYARAIQMRNNGQRTIAVSIMNETTAQYPDNPLGYLYVGLIYSGIEQYDLAIESYNTAIAIDPLYAPAFNNRALVYLELEDYESALSDHTTAIQLQPKDAFFYNSRGTTYSSRYTDGNGNEDDFAQALADFATAIELNPDYYNPYFNRGRLLAREGQYEDAMEDFNAAIAIEPLLVEAYLVRGFVHNFLGNVELALQDQNTVIQLDPLNADAYAARGQLYLDRITQYSEDEFDSQSVVQDANQAYRDLITAQGMGFTLLPEQEETLRLLEEQFGGILSLPRVIVQSGEISVGVNSGEIPESGVEIWTYAGEAGEVLTLYASPAQLTAGVADPQLSIRSPDSRLLAQDDDSGGLIGALIAHITLETTGIYTIEVGSYRNLSQGDYTLTLSYDPQFSTLISGENRGSIPLHGVEVWRFDAEADDILNVRMQADTLFLDGIMALYGPDGELLETLDDSEDANQLNPVLEEFILEADGTYELVVGSFNGQSEGEYSLFVSFE